MFTDHQANSEQELWACQDSKEEATTFQKEHCCLPEVKDHVDKPVAYWKNILWTDEPKLELFGLNGEALYLAKTTEFKPSIIFCRTYKFWIVLTNTTGERPGICQ